MSALIVRAVEPRDAEAWRALFDGYTRFYGRVPDLEISGCTWSRLVSDEANVGGLVAVDETGRVVGIANYVVHPSTSHVQPVCYLQDLFVDPAGRGRGAGRSLIDRLVAEMPTRGWARLYWNTKADNSVARALYDTYTDESGFVRYVLDAARAD